MEYFFVPNGFAGKESDDDTPAGLFRRMGLGGQNVSLELGGVVIVSTLEELPEQTILDIEAHYGCRQV